MDDLDATIREIRAVIFGLQTLGADDRGRRAEILHVASDERAVLGFEPRVNFAGPVDAVVPGAVIDDLVAVVREALTNVAKHSRASQANVVVEGHGYPGTLSVVISDDWLTMRRSYSSRICSRSRATGARRYSATRMPDVQNSRSRERRAPAKCDRTEPAIRR